MSRRSRLWALVALLIVMLLSFSFVVAQDAAGPEPVGERPDAPPYGLHGPYWVGMGRIGWGHSGCSLMRRRTPYG